MKNNTKRAKLELPRQKLINKGIQSLSDAELLAILIGTGTREKSAVELAEALLKLSFGSVHDLGKLLVSDFMKVEGIGVAKAVVIIAALELGRRRTEANIPERVIIKTSLDIYQFFSFLSDSKHEEFWILLLRRNNSVISKHRISIGGTAGTVVDAKIILKTAIDAYASSIVLCHNHPSGNDKPSQADKRLTRQLREAGHLVDILVIDHVIVADRSYFSFADNGII